jgi:hypothetical protein
MILRWVGKPGHSGMTGSHGRGSVTDFVRSVSFPIAHEMIVGETRVLPDATLHGFSPTDRHIDLGRRVIAHHH